MLKAERPTTTDEKEYHLHTSRGDLAPLCLIVGAPGRVDMIADKLLGVLRFENPHRGLKSCTGFYKGVRVSATTSGMGGPSTAIVLPEAVRSGARLFIRVGSCGSLIRDSSLGDVIVVNGAVRFDGVSDVWAPPEYPAFADHRVSAALLSAAEELAPNKVWAGVEATTSDFNQGQGRTNLFGELSERMEARHEEMLRLGVSCYSMEAATLFVWCSVEGQGLPAGVINAVFGNRIMDEWGTEGEELAVDIALEALVKLASNPSLMEELNEELDLA